MKNRIFNFQFSIFNLLLALLLVSCDSGNIAEKSYTTQSKGKTVKLTAKVSGLQSLEGTSYTVALAGFTTEDDYAVVQRALSSTTADSTEVELVLNNISDQVNTVELLLTNKLRERILTLASINMEDYADNTPTDTIRLDMGTINLSLFGCIQKGVFDNACVQCHGAVGHAAADMSLTEGNAYASLVNVASTRKEGETRVIAGDADNSLFHKLLNTGGENLLRYNHTEVLSSQFKNNLPEVKALLDNWINSGAKK